MVSFEEFVKGMSAVCLLVGQNPPDSQMKAIHKKIESFDVRDFKKACNDNAMLREFGRQRINYPIIEEYIIKHQEVRLEVERKKAEQDLKRAFKHEDISPNIRAMIRKITG